MSYQQSHYIPTRAWLAGAENFLYKLMGKNSPADERVKVSTWTDAKGVVHYENREVEGAKTIAVDPNTNVLPPAPVINLPAAKDEKPKTMNDELRDIQEAKKAHFESVINN
ncbi:hypothetical protein GCM10011613_07180 [Cellvibrio zantedeschiae]|uniref:DUF4124 domain-containing protein n=2 Tax=Cellvibrio zantedeschiae TaxID=1237077 RepID=A0ABQ3AUK5_9GAMM|nr:hypothetical protein GCM10011613_07180 [Cellvibrio zantedeschiae]